MCVDINYASLWHLGTFLCGTVTLCPNFVRIHRQKVYLHRSVLSLSVSPSKSVLDDLDFKTFFRERVKYFLKSDYLLPKTDSEIEQNGGSSADSSRFHNYVKRFSVNI